MWESLQVSWVWLPPDAARLDAAYGCAAMMNTKRLATNVLMNWGATAVGMVVPFFLTPFIVRSLGASAYGVWILAMSTVAYLNLLDLGLRTAVIRFVAKADADKDDAAASRAIGAALWFRLLIAAGVAVISVGLAWAFPHLFKIPPALERAAQITVLLSALGVAMTLVSGVFGAVLSAIHRFDILSTVTIVQTLLRASGVLLILHAGGGLRALACWELGVIAAIALITCGITLKIFPASRVRLGRPDLETLRTIWSYSFVMFIIIIAGQIVFNTDNLVVGAFLSVSLVAAYAIGGSLIQYASQVVTALSTTFVPIASNLEAAGRPETMRQFLLRGTQATLALALPISLTLLFRGKTFVGLWMGPQYSEISGTVIQILLVSQFFTVANLTAGAIMFATNQHKPVAKWASVEAALNLGLSLVLVRKVGVYGVAWGTALSMAGIHLLFWPKHVQRILGVPAVTYIWEGWLKITLCALPFAVATAAMDRYWPAPSILLFFAQVMLLLPLYAGCVALIFRGDVRELLQLRRGARAGQGSAAAADSADPAIRASATDEAMLVSGVAQAIPPDSPEQASLLPRVQTLR